MKTLYKWIKEKETIYRIRFSTFVVTVHNYIDCGDKWFLTCDKFEISLFDLKTTDLSIAEKRAITKVTKIINDLQEDIENVWKKSYVEVRGFENVDKVIEWVDKEISLLYQEERSGDIECANRKCKFYDMLMDQNCGGIDNNGDPLVMTCTRYKPLKRI